MNPNFIIDFDSTFVKVNTLEKLAGTNKRANLRLLKKNITASVKRNKRFFKRYKDNIFVVSDALIDYVSPIVKEYGIAKNHLFLNFTLGKKTHKPKLKGDTYIIGDNHTVTLLKTKHGIKNYKKVVKNLDELLYLFDLPRSLSYPKSKMKVLLLENINKIAVDAFKTEGYEIETVLSSMSEDELLQKIHDVSILGIRSKTKINAKVLEEAHKLLAIGAFCIGTDQIDLNTASEKGVAVFNAPYSNTRSVVELVMGEIIVLFRNVFDKSAKLHKGIWDKSANNAHEIRGKNLGIVGYGNIGSQLSVIAENLGMEVYFYDVAEKQALGRAHKCNSLKELLSIADVVTIHVDGNKANTNLIGENEFNRMKNGVIFINASRGFIVDINALTTNIKNGKVLSAAIDVFPNEPKNNNEKFVSSLRGLTNVILTPHIAGSTEEAQKNIGDFVSKKIIQFVNSGDTDLSVNFPQIKLPDHPKTHRLIHIHKNIPGMLAQINTVLAANKINIEGQYLKTNEQIGYVITDVNKNYDKKVIDLLKNIEGTVRLRILY